MPPVIRKRMEWHDARELHATETMGTWLNAAAIGAMARPVHARTAEVLMQMHTDPVGFMKAIPSYMDGARKAAAQLIHAKPDDIAFCRTSSQGMNMVALRLRRLNRDKMSIVTLRDEFPASTLPFKRLGFQLRMLRPDSTGAYGIPDILSRIDDTTAAVVVSHVQFRTGARTDLAALSAELAERKLPLVVNATQSAGVLPLDISKLDVSALVFSSHKWLGAGMGGAVLYLPERMRGEGFPPLAGWISARDPFDFVNHRLFPDKRARSLELGGVSVLPLVSLHAALDLVSELRITAIRDRVLELGDRLIAGLDERGARLATPRPREQRAGIVSVMRPDASRWVGKLAKKGIIVSQRAEDLVRIAPHYYNTTDEIDLLLDNWK